MSLGEPLEGMTAPGQLSSLPSLQDRLQDPLPLRSANNAVLSEVPLKERGKKGTEQDLLIFG